MNAGELAKQGLLDILSSDYLRPSLKMVVFRLVRDDLDGAIL